MSSPPKISEFQPPQTHNPATWFAEEVQPHGDALKAYLRSAYPAVRDTDDVVQESYLRVWNARKLQPIRSAKAFLFTVARRVALDVLRHVRRSPVDYVGDLPAIGVLDDGPVVHELVSRKEKVDLLVSAIDALPARCREVVILNKLKLLPAREVAERLGISEKGVEIQLHRGLDRLRHYLRRHGISTLLGPDS